jgi:hypothetical protein
VRRRNSADVRNGGKGSGSLDDCGKSSHSFFGNYLLNDGEKRAEKRRYMRLQHSLDVVIIHHCCQRRRRKDSHGQFGISQQLYNALYRCPCSGCIQRNADLDELANNLENAK